MTREQPFNGECGRELLGTDHREESVYCTECGTIFVPNTECGRRCPSCTLAKRLDEIEDRLDRAERDIDIVDSGGV